MSDREQLSAFIDGELDDDRLLDLLVEEHESSVTWTRYQLIGDTMRGELPEMVSFDLADRVTAALEDEPTVLAPKRQSSERSGRGKGWVVQFSKRVGQYAIAAAVAGVVIVGVQKYGDQQTPSSPGSVLNTVPLGGGATPVSANFNMAPAQNEAQMTPEQIQQQRQMLSAYFQDHFLQGRVLHQ
ncbi:sigma-E factor negative regulatory protein [Dongshaea marina]|uniref:sigma-E factor negative regulatory protein n=1 Tax=Dongshaea marina TaxID=2047966 RepID=UPI000D3E22D6|nr:RseA family anti-sigma factor [Dongshaea marina]